MNHIAYPFTYPSARSKALQPSGYHSAFEFHRSDDAGRYRSAFDTVGATDDSSFTSAFDSIR